jgi:Holliday junction resolvase
LGHRRPHFWYNPLMARQQEAKLSSKIIAFIREQGGWAFKTHASEDSFQDRGLPDIIGCYRGTLLGLEVKLPGNTPSKLQVAVLHEIRNAGGYTDVVRTVGQVALILGKIDREADR